MASKSSYSEGEKGAEVEDQLDALDKLVERLRVMYEQYFLGLAKQPPSHLHNDAERKFRDLAQLQLRNTALRYRFATIGQKFGSYNQYWRRILREIEQGRYIRDLSRIKRRAQTYGDDIPAEILAAMPKRMREMIERDRAAAVATSARRSPGKTQPPPPHVAEDAAVVRDAPPPREPGNFHRLGSDALHDVDLLDAIAREAEDAVDLAMSRLKIATTPPPLSGAEPPRIASAGAEPPRIASAGAEPPPLAPVEPGAAPRPPRLPTTRATVPPPASRNRRDSDTIPTPMGDVHPDHVEPAAQDRQPARGSTHGRAPRSSTAPRPGTPPTRTGTPSTSPLRSTSPGVPPPIPARRAATQTASPPPPGRATTEMAAPPPPPGLANPPPRRALARPAPEPPPGMSDADARALYTKFLKARELVGESNDGMTYDKLIRTLRQQGARIMEQYKARGVEFGVVIKDKKVILKAKPKG